jgi:NAD(P)-dependent dehydrogenase (short-subunit alcohol dehydrogenase family)
VTDTEDERFVSADLAAAGFGLEGKIVVVTGGSRGLGREIAMGAALVGAHVVIASRKLAACEDVARTIAERTGRRVLPLELNVGRWDQISPALDRVMNTFGRIDVVVNNAGSSPLYDSVQDVSEELFDKTIAVNMKGPFRLMADAGRRMVDAGGGAIVNISSFSAVNPKPFNLPYAAAKAGLNALTIGFARAFGPTVRVNCIMAGAFRTDVVRSWDMDAYAARSASLPLGRIGEPKEIVGAVLYFASPASSYTTGALLEVTGGAD